VLRVSTRSGACEAKRKTPHIFKTCSVSTMRTDAAPLQNNNVTI